MIAVITLQKVNVFLSFAKESMCYFCKVACCASGIFPQLTTNILNPHNFLNVQSTRFGPFNKLVVLTLFATSVA